MGAGDRALRRRLRAPPPAARGAVELEATLGTIDLEAVRAALDARTMSSSCPNPPAPVEGGSTPDPTAPARGPGDVDPNEPAFTVRLVVTDSEGNQGEDRKVLFAYRDPTAPPGLGAPDRRRGERGRQRDHGRRGLAADVRPRRRQHARADRGNLLRRAARGRRRRRAAWRASTAASRWSRRPMRTCTPGRLPMTQVAPPRRGAAHARDRGRGRRSRARDRRLGGRARLRLGGGRIRGRGLPGAHRPALSEPADRSRVNHIKRGFLASPSLGNLDQDAGLEIVVPSLDQHLYAWNGDGTPVDGYPVYLRERDGAGEPIPCSADYVCAETINTAAIGDIAGDSQAGDRRADGRDRRARRRRRGAARHRAGGGPARRPRDPGGVPRQRSHLRARRGRRLPHGLAEAADRPAPGRPAAGGPRRRPGARQRRRRSRARGRRLADHRRHDRDQRRRLARGRLRLHPRRRRARSTGA